jgi:hypothetical protein
MKFSMKALARQRRREKNIGELKIIARGMRLMGASPASTKKGLEGAYEILKRKGDSPLSEEELNTMAGSPSAPDLDLEEPGHLLAEVETRPINWLWHQRIPIGKITLLDGDPGMGKSLLAIDIAARVSTGQPMPDGTPGKQGGVVLVAPEDDASDTLKPRLEAAGGDPLRVRVLNTSETFDSKKLRIYDRVFSLSEDLDVLEKAIKTMQASLVILDPLMAILGSNVDSSRDQAIREVFTPLEQLAEQTGCAMLIIRHLNKVGSSNPLYRGAGSIGIIAAARAGFMVTPHPDNQNQRILATTKNNLSKQANNLVFQVIEKANSVPCIQWLGETDLTLSTLFSTSTNRSALRQDILSVLKDSITPLGPQEIAERTGYNHNTIRPTLRRMHLAQEITSVARGLYTTLHHPCLAKKSNANSEVTTEQVQHLQHLQQSL